MHVHQASLPALSYVWLQIRADDTTLYPDMVRLSVSAVDGSATTTTTTVSSAHIMHLVTDAAAKQEAGTPAERTCGRG